jgi:hypothetical protein
LKSKLKTKNSIHLIDYILNYKNKSENYIENSQMIYISYSDSAALDNSIKTLNDYFNLIEENLFEMALAKAAIIDSNNLFLFDNNHLTSHQLASLNNDLFGNLQKFFFKATTRSNSTSDTYLGQLLFSDRGTFIQVFIAFIVICFIIIIMIGICTSLIIKRHCNCCKQVKKLNNTDTIDSKKVKLQVKDEDDTLNDNGGFINTQFDRPFIISPAKYPQSKQHNHLTDKVSRYLNGLDNDNDGDNETHHNHHPIASSPIQNDLKIIKKSDNLIIPVGNINQPIEVKVNDDEDEDGNSSNNKSSCLQSLSTGSNQSRQELVPSSIKLININNNSNQQQQQQQINKITNNNNNKSLSTTSSSCLSDEGCYGSSDFSSERESHGRNHHRLSQSGNQLITRNHHNNPQFIAKIAKTTTTTATVDDTQSTSTFKLPQQQQQQQQSYFLNNLTRFETIYNNNNNNEKNEQHCIESGYNNNYTINQQQQNIASISGSYV